MQPSSPPPQPSASSASAADKIRQLSEPAQAAFRAFQAGGEAAALDPLILGVLEYYAPRRPATPFAEMPGSTRLMDDLGFDSLAITEIVFYFEDLFEIRIANEEILAVRTLDDLRTFVRSKLAARAHS